MRGIRIGHGYDVHAYTEGDGFQLGGVWIDCERAVIAHSDGDVAIHALCDALLGALGRGDIGQRFPDGDARNRDRDSREFLQDLGRQLADDGYRLGNADLTLIAQAPKLAPRLAAMRTALAEALACDSTRINIKATTTEGLGFIGREEGIAAAAVVLLEPLA